MDYLFTPNGIDQSHDAMRIKSNFAELKEMNSFAAVSFVPRITNFHFSVMLR